MITSGRPRPSWRAPDGRAARPELWLGAAALVGVLLVEVWQTSHMAESCLRLEQSRTALERANAQLRFVRADLDRRTTRAELAPLASELGLAPAHAQQVVTLPTEYLAADASGAREETPGPLPAWAERAMRSLVPEATARDRAGN